MRSSTTLWPLVSDENLAADCIDFPLYLMHFSLPCFQDFPFVFGFSKQFVNPLFVFIFLGVCQLSGCIVSCFLLNLGSFIFSVFYCDSEFIDSLCLQMVSFSSLDVFIVPLKIFMILVGFEDCMLTPTFGTRDWFNCFFPKCLSHFTLFCWYCNF